MTPIYINITEQQKNFFEQRRKQTGIPVAVQIRAALDTYMKKTMTNAPENQTKEKQII